MNFFLVTYSLRNPLRNYESFFVALRGNSFQWCHYIEQTMLVYTRHSAFELQQKLVPMIEQTDSLLIVPMPDANQLAGLLPKEAWEWMHAVSGQKATAARQLSGFIPPPLLR